jgi:hypothetical protein
MIEGNDGHRSPVGLGKLPSTKPLPTGQGKAGSAPPPPPAKAQGDRQSVAPEAGAAAAAAQKGQHEALATYGEPPAAKAPKPPVTAGPVNELDQTQARPIANVVAGVANGGDVLKDAATYGNVLRGVATEGTWLSRLLTPVGNLVDGAATLVGKVPGLLPACSVLSKVAPALGFVVAGLDVTRAVLEPNAAKRSKYTGQAALSTVGAVAGLVGFLAFTGTAVLGLTLAPVLAPIALGVGVAASVVSMADDYFNQGRISSALGRNIQSLGR